MRFWACLEAVLLPAPLLFWCQAPFGSNLAPTQTQLPALDSFAHFFTLFHTFFIDFHIFPHVVPHFLHFCTISSLSTTFRGISGSFSLFPHLCDIFCDAHTF